MLPVPGLRFLRHRRPGTAEVSLSLCLRLGDRRLSIVKSHRDQRGHRSASMEWHLYPQPTAPVSGRRALALVPDRGDRLSARQGFCSFAREAWPLARTHIRHVFSLHGCPARPARPRWRDRATGRQASIALPQWRRRDFLPLGCAHSSRAKKVSPPPSSAALRPQGVRRRSPAACRSPSRPRWSRARTAKEKQHGNHWFLQEVRQ
jgi:hypothetical protein